MKFTILASFMLLIGACATPSVVQQSEQTTQLAYELKNEVDGEVVGYAFALGTHSEVTGAGGFARTAADGRQMEFTAETPMIVASVSKWITAIGTMAVLQEQSLSIHEPIGQYFPEDWDVDPSVASITFAQLITQTSGVRAFGNGPKPYADLKEFFTQNVDPRASGGCENLQGSSATVAIAPQSKGYCYTNYNSELLRILLPKVADANLLLDGEVPGQTYARAFERLIQRKVFQPLDVDATCNPEGKAYALSYIYPGNQPGKDWGQSYDRCGSGGWYISAVGLARLLGSVADRDGRVLREDSLYSSFDEMRTLGIGIGRNQPDMMEKDGVLGDDPGVLSVSAMIYRPDSNDPLPIVLLINSTNSAIEIAHARAYIERALAASSNLKH
ncbi:MAG: serine hydrolase domain-containing protein [Erythrobacter sp.]